MIQIKSSQVYLLEQASDLSSLEGDWNRLAGDEPMRQFAWARCWIESLGAKSRPFVIVVEIDGHIEGIFPLARDWSLLHGRRLRLMGSGKACGDNLGLLTSDEHSEEVSRQVACFLRQASDLHQWDSLELDGLQPGTKSTQDLLSQLATCGGLALERKESPNCWSLQLENSWEDYLASLSKRMRKIFRELHTVHAERSISFEVASTLEDAKAKLDSISKLHQARWENADIEGCFSTTGFTQFLNAIVESWWYDNQAFVATIRWNNRNIAGTIGYLTDEELGVYLVGTDIELSDIRPGWMLNAELIQHAIKTGKRRVNFLRGDEAYKARLNATGIEQQRWIVSAPRLLPRLRSAAIRHATELRAWLKRPRNAADRAVNEHA